MPSDRQSFSALVRKLTRIRMVILDVDGVLTDGTIGYNDCGNEYKCFNAHDGFGIRRALEKGLLLAIITGRSSPIVTKRAGELGIREVHQGVDEKFEVFGKLRKKYRLRSSEICSIGDDEPDLPILKASGVSAAPSSAIALVRSNVDVVTVKEGGNGAVRELLDIILRTQKRI